LVVIYVSDHGYGHAVRCVFLADELIRRGVRCHLVCDRPDWLFASLPAAGFRLHRRAVDAGLVQSDWLRIDPEATLARYRQRLGRPDELIENEAAFLQDVGADLVVCDAPPLACAAARRAGVPVVLHANFDWAWLYGELARDTPGLAPLAHDARRWYGRPDRVLRLPFHVGIEQHFSAWTDLPLTAGRLHRTTEAVRNDLGVGSQTPLLVWLFGGHRAETPDFGAILRALPDWHLLTYIDGAAHPRLHCLPAAFSTTELMSVADALIGKLGYGTCAEACAFGVPFLYFSRPGYPEDVALEAHTQQRMSAAPLQPADIEDGGWLPKLHALRQRPRPSRQGADGAARAAEYCLQEIR